MTKEVSPARNALIVQMRDEGVGPRAIARSLKLSPSTVSGVLFRYGRTLAIPGKGRGNGVTPEFKAMVIKAAEKMGYAQAGRTYGVSAYAVSMWARGLM